MRDDEPEFRLRIALIRTWLFFVIVQGGGGLIMGAFLVHATNSWLSASLIAGLCLGVMPPASAFAVRAITNIGADEKGIYSKGPKHVSQMFNWVYRFTPWSEIERITPSIFGFFIKTPDLRAGMLPPFCFDNWSEFEALLRENRPELFKD